MTYEALGQCPVCGSALDVARLHCPHCQTTIDGSFSLGRFAHLTREQTQFLEAFLRARGVIKDVEEALGISYPTVRGRLDELLRALGLADDRERDRERRRVILADLSEGKISSEEAMTLLASLGSQGTGR
jgi:hypothetical protein